MGKGLSELRPTESRPTSSRGIDEDVVTETSISVDGHALSACAESGQRLHVLSDEGSLPILGHSGRGSASLEWFRLREITRLAKAARMARSTSQAHRLRALLFGSGADNTANRSRSSIVRRRKFERSGTMLFQVSAFTSFGSWGRSSCTPKVVAPLRHPSAPRQTRPDFPLGIAVPPS